jgi:predicted DNA-binding transcriptional regulator YafY
MGKLSNTLTMLELLSSGKKYTIKELSERLEVSPRMIRVYKEELEKAGIYVDSIRGLNGGYILDNKQLIPQRNFSKYDIQLLENVYQLIENNNQFKLNKEYLNLIDKIGGIYHSTRKKGDINVYFDADEKKKYNTLGKAIKEKRKVLINFLSADGTARDRIIHPCDMFYYDNSWYISAFCELRNEIRHFRLERILKYELLEDKYV